MRRLRETGIVTILLLGLTGCAGVQQRLGWTEPPYLGEEGSEDGPLSRLAFWRRHRTEEAAPTASAPGSADPARSTMIAGNGTTAVDDEDRPGLLRRLPLVGRLWRADDRDESDAMDATFSRYTVARYATGTPASAPPATTAGGMASAAPAGDANPASATASAAAPAPAPTPETAATEPGRSEEQPLRELTADLAGSKPQVDSAAVPARNPGSPTGPDSPRDGTTATEAAPPIPNLTNAEAQQGGAPPPPAAPAPSAAIGAQPGAPPDLSSASTSSPAPSQPSAVAEGQPASGSPPASSGWTSTVVSTPGPIWPAAGQAMVMTSSQSGYVSGGCDATCGPKCKKHKLCPLKKHKQQVVGSSVVLPSSQSIVSSCEATAPCKVKKPCFLKTWLHHKSGCKNKGCKGCKSCTYCGEPATMVSAQGPIVSPQW